MLSRPKEQSREPSENLKTNFLARGTSADCGLHLESTKQEIGTVSGAVVGGIVGISLTGNSAGTIRGSTAGACIDNCIGKELEWR